MSQFDDDTAVVRDSDNRLRTRLDGGWSIGGNSNGGYAMSPVLRVMRDLAGFPDPVSVTAHFLRPARGGTDAEVTAGLIRQGRTIATVHGDLSQEGKARLTVLAAFGDLSVPGDVPGALTVDRPDVPGPDECLDRSGLEQGVDLPILSRVDVRIRPEHAVGGQSPEAVLDGWIRLCDGADPSVLTLPLFADAFPPALYPRFGRIGWTPTIELTVHVRRRPAPGWVQARFECDDLLDGRLIETGSLWDSTGALVARSRQLGLMLPAG